MTDPIQNPKLVLNELKDLDLLDDLIRPREKLRRECQSDLFRRFQVDDKLKLGRLLHRQISRFGSFKILST